MNDTERLEWLAETTALAERHSNTSCRDMIVAVGDHFRGIVRNTERGALDVFREAIDAAMARD